MKALTIYQPWAWAICHAGKRIENRTWAPPPSSIGELLAIHAAIKVDGREAFDAVAERCPELLPRILEAADLPTGCVVAVARITDILRRPPSRSSAQFVWWSGPIAVELDDVVVLPSTVPCRGRQKLWNLPEKVAAEVDHQCGKLIQ